MGSRQFRRLPWCRATLNRCYAYICKVVTLRAVAMVTGAGEQSRAEPWLQWVVGRTLLDVLVTAEKRLRHNTSIVIQTGTDTAVTSRQDRV